MLHRPGLAARGTVGVGREVPVRDESARLHVARQVRVLVQSEERVSVVMMMEGFQKLLHGQRSKSI